MIGKHLYGKVVAVAAGGLPARVKIWDLQDAPPGSRPTGLTVAAEPFLNVRLDPGRRVGLTWVQRESAYFVTSAGCP